MQLRFATRARIADFARDSSLSGISDRLGDILSTSHGKRLSLSLRRLIAVDRMTQNIRPDSERIYSGVLPPGGGGLVLPPVQFLAEYCVSVIPLISFLPHRQRVKLSWNTAGSLFVECGNGEADSCDTYSSLAPP